MTPEETIARLLYRDGMMLVFNKPAGVAVHAGPKGGPSLEDDFDALRFGLPRKPALAHRLDHWAAVLDVHAFDVEVGVGRALELAEARLA